MIWVDWIAIISTILLIIAVLLQSSDDNIQDAFSGEKSELFKIKNTWYGTILNTCINHFININGCVSYIIK